ncbi:hypothetical protein J6590_023498 [Homalodisca vitripennis]|nr:hypothetical protein J6590_023498 [Homalodisca vitripennis]
MAQSPDRRTEWRDRESKSQLKVMSKVPQNQQAIPLHQLRISIPHNIVPCLLILLMESHNLVSD